MQIGRATDARLDTEARERMRVDSRYRWLGELDHTSANRWLARSHALVVSGRNDDSVNAVAEALGVGLPVMASRIDGHVGLLGDDYPAYFPEGNDCALAALLARAQERPGFYGTVAAAVQARRHLVEPTKERKAIRALLAELRARKA